MECSICFENITKETGKAELSCSHTFHLKCLSNWFSKNENCPCCRHAANDMEKMGLLEPVEGDEYTDTDDDYTDDDTDDEDDDIELNAARERARYSFRLKRWDMTKDELEAYAVTRIAALVRGHQSRKVLFELKFLKQREVETMNDIIEFQKDLISIERGMVFYKKLASMSYSQRRAFAATKIQSLWKSRKQFEIYKLLKPFKSLRVTLNNSNETITRTVTDNL